MTESITDIESVPWADSSFTELSADYETVRLRFSTEDDSPVEIVCQAHVSVSWVGHWDENIVETVFVDSENSRVAATLEAIRAVYGEHPRPGGGVRKIDGPWRELTVRFLDGVELRVVATSFCVHHGLIVG